MLDNNEPIGYKKPPRHSRFKPGRSGNPKGRPRNQTKSFKEYVLKELEVKIWVTENNKKHKMTKCEAIMKSLVNDFARNDKKISTSLMQALISIEERIEEMIPLKMIIHWEKPDEPPKLG